MFSINCIIVDLFSDAMQLNLSNLTLGGIKMNIDLEATKENQSLIRRWVLGFRVDEEKGHPYYRHIDKKYAVYKLHPSGLFFRANAVKAWETDSWDFGPPLTISVPRKAGVFS